MELIKLFERELNTALRLTSIQKTVLAKIASSPTEKIAGDSISQGEQLTTARDILVKLGMISFSNGFAALTTSGEEYMKSSNLMDEEGKLTDDGENFAFPEEEVKQESYDIIKSINKNN